MIQANELTIPSAQATLVHGNYSWVWVVKECPYCRKSHEHYGGPLDGDPQQYLGLVTSAKCTEMDRKYLVPHLSDAELQYFLQDE